jgi:transcriptional regulator with XRE-family HTH domain
MELGLTQAELAERAGMTQPQLSRLEPGGATPTVPLLARLATALKADLDITFRRTRLPAGRRGGARHRRYAEQQRAGSGHRGQGTRRTTDCTAVRTTGGAGWRS